MTPTFTFMDLFAGAGGLTLGFVRAGFTPVIAVESQPNFAKTYAANFGTHVLTGTVEEHRPTLTSVRADVVVGGPPCQGFSNLNGNKKTDVRRGLWQGFMDVVDSSGCSMFVMENVPNILTSAEGAAILSEAARLGYHTVAKVLLASHYGVPQNRRRAFIVGSKAGVPFLPAPTGTKSTVRDSFAGIPAEPSHEDFHSLTQPLRTDALHLARTPTVQSLARYKYVPPGGNRYDLARSAPELTPRCWLKKTKGGTDIFGRLLWDEPARCTIRTEFYKPEKGRYLHPEEDRPITHWEAARLQTFPDDFLWCGSKMDIAIQIGNAVPPLLAEAIAIAVRDQLTSSDRLRTS